MELRTVPQREWVQYTISKATATVIDVDLPHVRDVAHLQFETRSDNDGSEAPPPPSLLPKTLKGLLNTHIRAGMYADVTIVLCQYLNPSRPEHHHI